MPSKTTLNQHPMLCVPTAISVMEVEGAYNDIEYLLVNGFSFFKSAALQNSSQRILFHPFSTGFWEG
jgi:hypothetical protein